LVFGGLGRRERLDALGNYLRGLLLEGERKSIEPIAQRLVKSAGDAEAMRQRIQQGNRCMDRCLMFARSLA
jgi:hypothetical protein